MSKRILITGIESYIGTNFKKWIEQYNNQNGNQYVVDMVTLRDDSWRNVHLGEYDCILHVAGIAHVDVTKKDSLDYEKSKKLYYKINRDLTIELAKKAKLDGAKQFIFLSSIIVYGNSSRMGEKKVIKESTKPSPTNYYGDSKLQAEQGIISLQSEDFHITVLRPPMIYGKGSKGNYPKLSKVARLSLIFPNIDNERSMLHIDNLCEFIRLIIDDMASGIYFPQNKEYVKTTELVKVISKVNGKRIYTTKLFNIVINLIGKRVQLISKIFGSLVYDKELSNYYSNKYCVRDFYESIELTEVK
jgi:nucleoside-diphosphate-sugar epimerase